MTSHFPSEKDATDARLKLSYVQ